MRVNRSLVTSGGLLLLVLSTSVAIYLSRSSIPPATDRVAISNTGINESAGTLDAEAHRPGSREQGLLDDTLAYIDATIRLPPASALIFPDKSPDFGERIELPERLNMKFVLLAPQGRNLLFGYYRPGESKSILLLRDMESGRDITLFEEGRELAYTEGIIATFGWLPSGTEFVYTKQTQHGMFTMHLYDIEERTSRRIGGDLTNEPQIAGIYKEAVVSVLRSYEINHIPLNTAMSARRIGILPFDSLGDNETNRVVRKYFQVQAHTDSLYFLTMVWDKVGTSLIRRANSSLSVVSLLDPAESYRDLLLPDGPPNPTSFKWNSEGKVLAVSGAEGGLVLYSQTEQGLEMLRSIRSAAKVRIESFGRNRLIFSGTHPEVGILSSEQNLARILRRAPYFLSLADSGQ